MNDPCFRGGWAGRRGGEPASTARGSARGIGRAAAGATPIRPNPLGRHGAVTVPSLGQRLLAVMATRYDQAPRAFTADLRLGPFLRCPMSHKACLLLGACLMILNGRIAAGAPDIYEVNHDPNVGFNLISWWNFNASGQAVWEDAVQDLYDNGFRDVSISPVRFVDPATGSIAVSSMKGPELDHVAAGIARAKSLGMQVTVNPFVEIEDFAFWRGNFNPVPGSAVSDTFWNDYEQYLTDVANVAEANGAEAMTVGTELKAITRESGNNAKWNSVITSVDGVFHGSLGYAANWDNFKNSNLTSTVWDHPAIDFLGVDAYFRIVTNAESDASGSYPDTAFLDLVEEEWTAQLDTDILPFAAARKGGAGMPVYFTEYGLTPFNRGVAQHPTSEVDQDEQVMGFAALMRAMDGRAGPLPKIHVWQWGMPGAVNSNFYLNPGAQSNIGGNFDESLNVPAAEWLRDFIATAVLRGDMDCDGDIDFDDIDDFVLGLNNASAYESIYGMAPAIKGDVDGDADHDFDDISGFVQLLAMNEDTLDPATVAEPACWMLAGWGFILVILGRPFGFRPHTLLGRRRRSHA